jgi:hypothetical protein
MDDWWATLSPARRVKVIVSVYEDDMAYGRVLVEMRGLALIRPGEARRTVGATGLRRICWPTHLADAVIRLVG